MCNQTCLLFPGIFFFFGGGGFLGCFFAHLPPWGCLQAGNSQGTHGHLSVPQCSLFVLQRLNINVEVLPVSQYGLQGNLMEMHQVCVKGRIGAVPLKRLWFCSGFFHPLPPHRAGSGLLGASHPAGLLPAPSACMPLSALTGRGTQQLTKQQSS